MGLDLDVKQRLAQKIDEFPTGDVLCEVGRAIEMTFRLDCERGMMETWTDALEHDFLKEALRIPESLRYEYMRQLTSSAVMMFGTIAIGVGSSQ